MTQRAVDGDYVYFVTANVQDRRWFFVTLERAAKLGQAIQTSCRMKNFDLAAYCILPNHIHLLVRKLTSDESSSAQRTLERVRCETKERSLSNADTHLFPHRRLSSRRCGSDTRYTLSDLMKSIKGTFSRTLPNGKFWQHRSNFRIVETETYLANLIEYIRYNYRKMNLPEIYAQPPFVFIDERTVEGLF